MGTGRKPAQCAPALQSNSALSSNKLLEVAKIIPQESVSQLVFAANYCNHSPSAPKLFIIPSNHKPRAKIVQETDKKLASAYAKPKTSLKTLQFRDESGHQVRSQRREAAIALLQVMNYYQDDATGRIGRSVDGGGFRDMSLKSLAEKAGIAIRRAIRALKDITRAGYLKVTKQFIRNPETGEVKGLPSIRTFKAKLFTDLDVKGDVWTKWFTQRGWAQQRADKKVSKQQKKKARAMFGLVKDQLSSMGKKAGNKILGIISSVTPVESEKTRQARIDRERNLYRKALDLFNLDPSKSPSEYYAALKSDNPPK